MTDIAIDLRARDRHLGTSVRPHWGPAPGTVIPHRVAVIEERPPMRFGIARAVAQDSALELALSSACLADAFALSSPPDLIVLGQWGCDESIDPAASMELHARTSAMQCSVLVIETELGPGPASGADIMTCSEADGVRRAIHSALASRPSGSASADPVTACQPQPGPRPRPALSAQEHQALRLYTSGMTLEAVASAMYVTPNTAATYLKRVRAKFRELGDPAESKLALRDCARGYGLLEG